MPSPGPLGWITPALRTQAQHDLHAAAVASMPKFTLTPKNNASPVKVLLTDAWKDPLVVADVGFVFPRFHQLTGSCVGAGGGQALFTLIAVQRLLATNPTTAFIPFWPLDYGLCRQAEGDRGQGEGAMGSSFAATVVKNGVLDAKTAGLPQFQNNDGLVLTENIEMQWSDGASIAQNYIQAASPHPVGTAAPITDVASGRAALLNGYPWTFACDRFIGNASIQGSGADAAVVGYWDNNGGHQQSVHGVWDNPTLGPLYLVQNNWPASTYPSDPAGGPPCSCWVTEARLERAFGYNAEVYAFSHLNWFPAQPQVLDWTTI